MHRAHFRRTILSTRKDIWNLDQTLYTNSFAFKVLNPHRFATKNTGLELFFCVGGPFKGENDSLASWLV